jgi:hypothetical protein
MTWSITVLLKDFASVTALGGGLKMEVVVGGSYQWLSMNSLRIAETFLRIQ